MKKRFTEEQIIGVLKEADAGAAVAESHHRYGVGDATYNNWKAKFGGLSVSDVRRLEDVAGARAVIDNPFAKFNLDPRPAQLSLPL